jgi:hypothetical protein
MWHDRPRGVRAASGYQDTGQAAPAHRLSVDPGQRQRSFGAHAMFSREGQFRRWKFQLGLNCAVKLIQINN